MENGDIPDSSITASDYFKHVHLPEYAKERNELYWSISPLERHHSNHWLLIDLGKVQSIEVIYMYKLLSYIREDIDG